MQDDLPKTAANHVALSPVSFLPRAAHVWGKRIAIIHGARRITYAQFLERSRRLASALRDAGIAPGDVVAALLPNIPEMLEAHNGVPMAHAVLCPINTRLDAATIRFILGHSGAKILLLDREFAALVNSALDGMENPPRVIIIDDPEGPGGAAIDAWLDALLESVSVRDAARIAAKATGLPRDTLYARALSRKPAQ